MSQLKNKLDYFYLMIVVVIVSILTTAGAYYILKHQFLSKQQEDLVVTYNTALVKVEQDIQRSVILLNYISAEILSTNLPPEQDINKIVEKSNYSQKKIFTFFHNYYVEWSQDLTNNIDPELSLLRSNNNNLEVLQLEKRVTGANTNGKIILKVDRDELLQNIQNSITGQNVRYELYNNHNKIILTNYQPLNDENFQPIIFLDKGNEEGNFRLKLWIDQNFLKQTFSDIRLTIFYYTLIGIGISILMYFLCRLFLIKFIYQANIKQIEQLEENLLKISSSDHENAESLMNLRIELEAKNEFDSIVLNKLQTKIQKTKEISQVCIDSLEGKINLSNEQQIKVLSIITDDNDQNNNLIMNDNVSDLVDIKVLINQACNYNKQEIRKKNIKILTEWDVNDIHLEVGKAAIYQLFYSLIFNIIFSLPKGKVIKIISKQLEKYLDIEIIDNGFGLEPDDIDKCSELNQKKHSKTTILGWKDLSKSMKDNNIIYLTHSDSGVGNKFKLQIPLYQLQEEQSVELSPNINPSIDNIYWLSDHFKKD